MLRTVDREHECKTGLSLLLRHTDGPSSAAGRLGVLPADAQSPEMTQATVGAHLLHPFQVVTQLRVHGVGENLRVLAVDNVTLPVEEPYGDLVLCRVLDDGDDALEFFRGEFTGAGRVSRRMEISASYRLLRSTSAFLQTKLEYRRPTPLILVKAYMTFCLPALVRGLEVAELKRTIDVGVEKTQLSRISTPAPRTE